MHDYMTRQMVALKPMTYAGWPVDAGDPFLATPIDGDYFIRCGRAKDAAPVATVAPPLVQKPVAEQPDPDAPAVTPAARRTYTRRPPAAAAPDAEGE